MIQMLLTHQREFAKGLKRARTIKAVCKEYGLIVVCPGVDSTCVKEIKGRYGNKGTELA